MTEPDDNTAAEPATPEAAVDTASESAPNAAGGAPEASLSEPTPAPDAAEPRRGLDDVSRIMLRLVLMLVTVLLGTTLFLLLYVSTLNRAPRTTLERDLAQWETAVKESPQSAEAWAKLAYTYAQAGRTEEALKAVRRGEAATDVRTLTLVEGDVLRSAGRYAEALGAYNTAERELRAAQSSAEEERKKVQIFVPIEKTSLAPVYFGRGLCRRELGDLKGAAGDLERATKAMPGQAEMLVVLGDVYAELGQKEKARARFQEALRYVPDDADALHGLSDLKEGSR